MANKALKTLRFPGLDNTYIIGGSEADEYSSSATYAVGDYVTHEGKLYRCTTAISTAEVWTAGHWAETKMGNEVSGLKTALTQIETDYYETKEEGQKIDENISMPNSGLLNANGSVTANASYNYSNKIAVRAGDSITIDAEDSGYGIVVKNIAANRICCYSNNAVVSAAGSDSPGKPFVVPEGIDEMVITLLAVYINVVIHINRHVTIDYPKIDALLVTNEKECVLQVVPEIVPNKFVNKSGTISTNSSYYYFTLDVKAGDYIGKIRAKYNNGASIVTINMRYVCAYVGIAADSSLGAESVADYTVPDTVTKVAITVDANYPLSDHVCIYRNSDVNEPLSPAPVSSSLFASNPQKVTGDLAVSSTLTLTANSVKKNKEIIFSGKITSFNKLTIGQGGSDLNSEKVEIDGTNIVIYNGTNAAITNSHGLTISDYINVTIFVDEDYKGHFNILTGSGKYTYDSPSIYLGCMSNIYATTDASTALTDCSLSFVCNDIDEPIWIFGDSYVSYFNDKWLYYVANMGFKRYLLNGYSGEPSSYAIKDLNNLLAYGTPKYIVWALGMNDKDSVSAINGVWESCIHEVIALCNEKNIKLILCTIPNVPDRSHTYKNAFIMDEDNGFQYINFADAVGALDDSTWYTGMLSQDSVHPTETGAIALASQVLKDFPLICII